MHKKYSEFDTEHYTHEAKFVNFMWFSDVVDHGIEWLSNLNAR